MGNAADHERGTVYGNYDQAYAQRVETVAAPPMPPPPARVNEVVYAAPSSDAIWVPGHWRYRGRYGYAWVPGHWEIPPPQARSYIAGHWERHGNRSVWIESYWR
ncbi:MAG: hypothetical protein C0518_13590 [Opitutus sp.]|nr:hypothetical protein [Opitutus sp.]